MRASRVSNEDLYEIYDSNKTYKPMTIRKARRDQIPTSVYLGNGGYDLEDISPITDIMEINGKETKYADDIFHFRNGTTEEKALSFLNEGKGFTSLESWGGFYIKDKDYISNFGIQVHEQSYQSNLDWANRDSVNYANMASNNYGGRAVVIEGSIPSKYVYQQKNEHEFAIPRDYHDKITEMIIKDANTGEVLHTFKRDTESIKPKNINEEYENILKDHFDKIDEELYDIEMYGQFKYRNKDRKITDQLFLELSDKEEGLKSHLTLYGDGSVNTGGGINVYKNHDNVIVHVHGAEINGKPIKNKIAYKKADLEINDVIQELENAGIIPKDTKQIYTISCFGGLQESGVTANGIPFESAHTSEEQVYSLGHETNKKLEEKIENKYKLGEINEEEYTRGKRILEYRKKLVDNHVISGEVTKKYKENVISLYEKDPENFLRADIIATEEEIDDALHDIYTKRIKEKASKQTKITEPTKELLTSKEAFDKYGPDSDEFFTSQGLDPNEQKQKLSELNKKQSISEEENLEQLKKETKEAEDAFYETQKEANKIIEDYQKLPKEEIEPPTKIETKPQPKVEKVTQEVTEELEEKAVEGVNKLEEKTIQNTAKEALNMKKLGIGAAIGIGAIAIGKMLAPSKRNETKPKEEKQSYLYKNKHRNEDYSQNLAYANSITNFSTGHSTYSL